MIDALPLLLAPEGYQISRSVRLRSSASAYLTRTPASASNRTTWTWSGWAKRATLGATQSLFQVPGSTSSTELHLYFGADNALGFYQQTSSVMNAQLNTTQVFRDTSAWYHVVGVWDTNNATAGDRLRLYVNGSRVTAFGINTTASSGLQSYANTVVAHQLGRALSLPTGTPFYPMDGYLTEINFIDGQALDASYFGEFDAITGVWKPKKYTGTYGTNGFYLNFSDNSAATAAAIGKDYSGNGNNWTPNNISLAGGFTYDSMIDVPTNWADGGTGRGNYAVFNPLGTQAGPGTATLSAANLNVSASTAGAANATFAVGRSGKWYAEFQITSTPENATNELVGITTAGLPTSVVRAHASNGQYYNGGAWVAFGSAWAINDVIGVAMDVDNSQLSFYKNGVQQGTTQSYTFVDTDTCGIRGRGTGTSTFNANFGQRPFSYTPPTGFKALNTQNLPDSLISNGRKWFDAKLYTGTAPTSQTISGLQFSPDLVWIKNRSYAATDGHVLVDAVRGVTKTLSSSLTNAEFTQNSVTAFTSDGFTVGNTDTVGRASGPDAVVAWTWKESATAGFDIVTFNATGVAGQTVAHSLGVVPAMVIIKNRVSSTENWTAYHQSLGATKYLSLNLTAIANTSASPWNNTAPSSSVVTLGNGYVSGNSHVMYAFAEVAGFSRFGSYTGNGSADGPYLHFGFRARWIMYKRTDSTGQWNIIDTARNPYNQLDTLLRANLSNADETNAVYAQDITANGWKIRSTNVDVNASGATYIFAAFAENPFKNALAR